MKELKEFFDRYNGFYIFMGVMIILIVIMSSTVASIKNLWFEKMEVPDDFSVGMAGYNAAPKDKTPILTFDLRDIEKPILFNYNTSFDVLALTFDCSLNILNYYKLKAYSTETYQLENTCLLVEIRLN